MKLPVGCNNLLHEFILYILITVIPGASGRCKYNQRQCSDGSCIPVNSVFMRCPDECKMMETKCPDTSCVSILKGCPNNCGSGYKQCRDGKCIPSYKKCPGECERRERECPDGSCAASYRGLCPGECRFIEKKCLDGTCISGRRCPEDCKHDEKWCPDGTCVSSSRGKCTGEPCPPGFPNSCTFGEDCYRDNEKCDGTWHCQYGFDEKNCISPLWWVWYLLIPCVVVVIIPCVVYFMCCKSKKKREICLDEEPAVQNDNIPRRANGTYFGHEERQGTYGHPAPQVPSAPPEADPEVDPQSEPEAPPSYASITASDNNWETPTPSTLPPAYANATVKTEFEHTGTADDMRENDMDRYGPQFWGTGPDH